MTSIRRILPKGTVGRVTWVHFVILLRVARYISTNTTHVTLSARVVAKAVARSHTTPGGG